jgi:hypothetical protein
VRQLCERRNHWGDDTDAEAVREALDSDHADALVYAAYVIAYEALPYEVHQRVKAERVIYYLKQKMVGKAVTEPQLAYLRALGYAGEPPADRAAASVLIDQLRQGRA